MLDAFLDSIKAKHASNPITSEHYARWRNNRVTRRFMEELELLSIETLAENATSFDINELAVQALIKQAHKSRIEDILDWKPAELYTNED